MDTHALGGKRAARLSADPVAALREGWDDSVRFAAIRPRLDSVIPSRVLGNAPIPAAGQVFARLIKRIAAVAYEGRPVLAVESAVRVPVTGGSGLSDGQLNKKLIRI
ncbi:hypothetical protein [Bordetella sp. FB-8]|uniref:hypothetical protein n=1 Tax=Bordetella sp. FB-8 TaxID=1159870 RepID=UPI00037373C7|nr:hypothetical protein [Bordetella sp. FB-8]